MRETRLCLPYGRLKEYGDYRKGKEVSYMIDEMVVHEVHSSFTVKNRQLTLAIATEQGNLCYDNAQF